jgi:hypothetical protein
MVRGRSHARAKAVPSRFRAADHPQHGRVPHGWPERRRVGSDARISVEGVTYEVDPDLAGEEVILWWGLFDRDLYVEHSERRYGPYLAIGGPIPLYRYRRMHKTRSEERADRVAALAERLGLPRAALDGGDELTPSPPAALVVQVQPFETATVEIDYRSTVAAKLAIADALGMPLARLSAEQRAWDRCAVARNAQQGGSAGASQGSLPSIGVGCAAVLSEVMDFYGLERDFQAVGFFETEQHRQLMRAIRPTLLSGKLAAITGPVGSGKTLFLRRFEAILEQEGQQP